MKKMIGFVCILYSLLGIAQHSFSQSNAVKLRLASGALLSTHSSVAAAYAALPDTLKQAYLIELAGNYSPVHENFPVVFSSKPGSSLANTLTIRPETGIIPITISHAGNGNALFILDDADFLVIDGRPGGAGISGALTIANLSADSNSHTIYLKNGAANNLFKYLNLQNATTFNTGSNIRIGASEMNAGGNSDNQFQFCTITGGRSNISSAGDSTNRNSRNIFYGCEIINIVHSGIWAQAGTGSLTIDSCRFFNNAPVADGPSAILFDEQTDTAVISRNKIFNLDNGSNSTSVRGICIRSVRAALPNLSRIYNNFISLAGSSSSKSVIGIEFAGNNVTNAEVYHNSVRISGYTTAAGQSGELGSTALYKNVSGFSNAISLRGNVFVQERAGSSGLAHVTMALNNRHGIVNTNYNTYYTITGHLILSGGTFYTNISSYKSSMLGQEYNSNTTALQFVSQTDLHLTGTALGNPNMLAPRLPDLLTDIDNQLRPLNTYRGADEAGTMGADQDALPAMFQLYPNPVTEFLFVRINPVIQYNTFVIRDLNGLLIFEQELKPQQTEIQFSKKELHVKPGIYLLQLKGSETIQTSRIVIQ